MKNITRYSVHSHDPQDQSVAVTKLRSAINEWARCTQLVVESSIDTPVGVRAHLGNIHHVKRSLRRQRAKHMPKKHA